MTAKHHLHLLADIEDYFERLEREREPSAPAHVTAQKSAWHPPTDIRETRKEYLIQMELAAVEKDAIDISVLEGMLTVHGERPLTPPGDDERHHRIGRMYGHFSRTFALPADADSQAIVATLTDGLLTVHVPKKAGAESGARRITVS